MAHFLARALLVVALVCSAPALAETRVYLLRGWFGVFSAGIDKMAEDLRAKGIQAEPIGHLEWKAAADKIASDRAAGATGPLVLVGHSQGGNNVVDMARELEKQSIRVDLIVTIAPWLQEPVPANVVRAINYYQSPGWGSPLTPAPGFKGEISNINVANDLGILHINIDKDARVQAAILSAIESLQ
jgi:thioesterase domain-containing protein